MWVCLGTLAILDRMEEVDKDMLAWWLAERQLPNGGLNGRPEKLEDVCLVSSYDDSTALIDVFLGLLQLLGPLRNGHPQKGPVDRCG